MIGLPRAEIKIPVPGTENCRTFSEASGVRTTRFEVGFGNNLKFHFRKTAIIFYPLFKSSWANCNCHYPVPRYIILSTIHYNMTLQYYALWIPTRFQWSLGSCTNCKPLSPPLHRQFHVYMRADNRPGAVSDRRMLWLVHQSRWIADSHTEGSTVSVPP